MESTASAYQFLTTILQAVFIKMQTDRKKQQFEDIPIKIHSSNLRIFSIIFIGMCA
jgi:hypothetical protein